MTWLRFEVFTINAPPPVGSSHRVQPPEITVPGNARLMVNGEAPRVTTGLFINVNAYHVCVLEYFTGSLTMKFENAWSLLWDEEGARCERDWVNVEDI